VALIPLKTPSASYDITIAPGLIKTLPARLKKLKGGKPFRTFIVTSPEIWGL
jgi:3-dehydroquinate synthase